MKHVLSAIDRYYKLSEQSKELLIQKLEPIRLKKDDFLLYEYDQSPYLYFIEKGAIKTHYIDSNGNKKVVWFGFEGDICFSICSYFEIEYISETIELIEDSLFYRIKLEQVKELYSSYCDWANWGRCFIEKSFVDIIREIDEHKAQKAKDKYLELIHAKPKIKARVPLKDIASYLGVSPVTISRLRKEIDNEL